MGKTTDSHLGSSFDFDAPDDILLHFQCPLLEQISQLLIVNLNVRHLDAVLPVCVC